MSEDSIQVYLIKMEEQVNDVLVGLISKTLSHRIRTDFPSA